MKVVLVVHQFFPRHQTGTEVYTYGLARELSTRHTVSLFYREHYFDRDIPPGLFEEDATVDSLSVHRIYINQPRSRLNFYTRFLSTYANPDVEESFARYLDRVKPDIVHIQHLAHLSGGLIDVAKEKGIPVVATLHDYWYLCFNIHLIRSDNMRLCHGARSNLACGRCVATHLRRPWLGPLLTLPFQRRNTYLLDRLKKADLLIAPSHFLAGQYAMAGLPAEKIVFVEHGLDLSRFPTEAERRPISPPIRFGYIGQLAWWKGVHVLIEAFSWVFDSAELVIYGDPFPALDYARDLRRLAADHPLIRFGGKFHAPYIGKILSQIDVLVVPSLWYENSPTVIQEAFAARVPVIASNVGALAEKVRDGEDGLLFSRGDPGDLYDKLISLIEEPERIESLRAHIGPVRSVEENAREVEAIYRRVRGGSPMEERDARHR